MRQLTIQFPERKFQFVMELLRGLKFIKIEESGGQQYVITEEQKALVEEEFRKLDENPDYALNWDDVKDQIFAD